MAVYPIRIAADSAAQPIQSINIEAWTVEAVASIPTASLTSPPLSIPLDEHPGTPTPAAKADLKPRTLPTGRPLLRRDSLNRRNALLKGKEGSRRRQRWENDHLLSNPHAQPPLPSDYFPHPTHPRRQVPYFLAPLWDADLAKRKPSTTNPRARRQSSKADPAVTIPNTLRATLKRAKAAKGLLQDLETEIRKFVTSWEKKQQTLKEEGLEHAIEDSSEDEEIVFVGRGGRMLDTPPSPKVTYRRQDRAEYIEAEKEREEVARKKLVFESLAEDRGASFGRYLVHSIATYYNLHTWSVTVGDPARREAYVGIKLKSGERGKVGTAGTTEMGLPRPLWGMV
ncbi:hypothetical protein MMC30_009262 [Trapelia coarctata]|nr:hypothetical protein [Trapelia coarctata]